MVLKAVHVSEVPNLDQHHENDSLALYSTCFSQGVEFRRVAFKPTKFLVVGHRGNGMNILQSSDRRTKAFKENSILSFNTAANFPADFIEFDVQVTKDDCPVIFHDDFILSQQDDGVIFEKRITDLSLAEFLSYGPQKETATSGKPLLRKTEDGRIVSWTVESDDALCTLQQAFEKVNPGMGFNIELKLDDYRVYQQDHLIRVLQPVLQVVFERAKDRPILFSTFQPDAALLLKKLQTNYPVFFLTDGGTELYHDVRRNSLEEAVKLCLEGGLEGIVSHVKAIFSNPGALNTIKDSKLSLLTYGKLNNVAEAAYMQHLMGIDGVIVDYVEEITEAVSKMLEPSQSQFQFQSQEIVLQGEEQIQAHNPTFSETELSFLLKLIPQLLKQ